jgi:hypothetical protein
MAFKSKTSKKTNKNKENLMHQIGQQAMKNVRNLIRNGEATRNYQQQEAATAPRLEG